MKKKSVAAADSKGRVSELQRRAQDARNRAAAAKKEAQDAKQRAREARRLFKEAKKVAKKARNELAALSEKLKKLINGKPRSKAGVAVAAVAGTKPRQSKKKSRSKTDQPKSVKSEARSNTPIESAAAESQPTTPPRRSRSSRKRATNESIEAVVDSGSAGEAPARTSEESVEPDGQNTPEESAA
jgi:hypothetical protein